MFSQIQFQNLLVSAAVLLVSQSAVAGDLFSEVQLGAVYRSTQEEKTETQSESGRRLGGVVSLRKALVEAGFDPELTQGERVVLRTRSGTSNVQFKVALSVSDRLDQIAIAAPLVKLDEKKLTTQRLLKLMERTRAESNMHYVTANQILSVRGTLDNKDVSAVGLRSKIEELVDFAAADVTVWRTLGQPLPTTSPKIASERPDTTPSSVVPAVQLSLIGAWSATGDQGESLGIVFQESKFRMAIVSGSNVSRSSGTWTLSGQRLVLRDGQRELVGVLTSAGRDSISLKFGTQNPLSFARQLSAGQGR